MLRARRRSLILLRPEVVLGTNLLVAAVVLGWVLWRFGAPALTILGAAPSWGLLAAFVAIAALVMVVSTIRWRLVLAGLGHSPSVGVLLRYGLAGQSISLLVPSARLGGEPVRAFLLARDGVPAPVAIASVAVDRVLDMASGTIFAMVFVAALLRAGIPALEGAFATVTVGSIALLLGIWMTVRRLQRRRGVLTAVARATRLDRLGIVERHMGVLAAAEEDMARLIAQPGRMRQAFMLGVATNLIILLEYYLLLHAFGLPTGPMAIVAALFGVAAAHSMPVPAGVGVLEGSQMFLFGVLGYPAEVGLAVGLAVRLRMLVWVLPGLVYLLARRLAGTLVRERVT